MDKQLIRRRFARQLSGYRSHASVQKEMAEKLVDGIAGFAGTSGFGRIFEIGCGAGILSEMLADRFQYRELILNDLMPECDAVAARLPRADFVPGDAEQVEFPAGIDLAASNAALQWMADLDGLFSKLARSLSAGGVLAFGSFSPRNLVKIRDLTGAGLDYLSTDQLRELGSKYFGDVEVTETEVALMFDSPLEALQHLRLTGVNAVSGVRWSKGKLAGFCTEYERRYRRPGGVSLTFAPVYFYARKEG